MAETDEGIKYKSYTESPARYTYDRKNEWEKWFDKQKPRIEENKQLFNNYSEDLKARQEDETLSRSCLFIPVLNPAILSRVPYLTNMTWQVDKPIEPVPKRGTPKKNAENVKALVHDLLQKDNIKETWIKKELASELYPVSFLKVSEMEEEDKELSVEWKLYNEIPFIKPKLMKDKEWKTGKKNWRTTVSLRTQEAVFYDTSASEWGPEVRYVGEVIPLTLGELEERKITKKYKFEKEDLKRKG